eukprot:1382267-Rhodomonas_salina.2
MTPITTAVALSPSYGGFRDKSSHSTTPNEYASDCKRPRQATSAPTRHPTDRIEALSRCVESASQDPG